MAGEWLIRTGEKIFKIAYHGDVLNTAARIRGYCNEFNKQLLASETLVQELEENQDFIIHLIGEVQLRGKEGLSRIYSCEKSTTNKGIISPTSRLSRDP